MTLKNPDLHGNVPDSSKAALLLVDVINDFDFVDSEKILRYARPMAEHIAALKRRAKQTNIPCIYVNDNFGKWQSDFRKLIEHCLRDEAPGKLIVEHLLPLEDDYFVLKPKHSAFFSTTLDTLLRYLGVSRLVITGVAGNICILFTASDAFMRDFEVWVPSDCIASNEESDNRHALQQMQQILKAHVEPSTEIDWSQLQK